MSYSGVAYKMADPQGKPIKAVVHSGEEDESSLRNLERPLASPSQNDTDSLPESDVISCSERLESAEKMVADLQDKLLRTVAEMENIRRRALKDKEDAIKFGNAALAKDILGFIDNLERALHPFSTSENQELKSLVEGLSLMDRDILSALERHGICKIHSDGQPFDPAFHQAVSEVPTEGGQPGIVHQTLQTGYTLNGRLLRAAMVVVTK